MKNCKKKIKILFIETVNNIGGGQIGLLDILESLDKKKFSLTIIVPSESGNFYNALCSIIGVSICIFKFIHYPKFINKFLDNHPYLPFYSPFSVRRLAKKIKHLNPDLVHANHILAGKYAAKAAKKLNIPSIITIRNVFYDKPFNLHRFLDNRLVINASKIVFNSNTGYSIFKNRTGADNVMVIRNGIKLHKFTDNKFNSNAFKKQYNLPQDKKIISTIGRLSYAKGQDILIKALPKIIATNNDCYVVFIGSESPGTEYKKKLQQLSLKLGVSKNISWIEFANNVAPFYKIAYATILPSILGEGLPRVIIESMASGTPAIGSTIAGIPELIKNNENGYLVIPGNVDSLIDAIKKIFSLSSQDYNRMCELNKKIAHNSFCIKHMMNDYIQLYKALTKSS